MNEITVAKMFPWQLDVVEWTIAENPDFPLLMSGDDKDPRDTYAYRQFRDRMLEGKRCELCGGTRERVWHHWKPVEDFPELCNDPGNGLVLCSDPKSPFGFCHWWAHGCKSWRHNVPDPWKMVRSLQITFQGIQSNLIPHGPTSRSVWKQIKVEKVIA